MLRIVKISFNELLPIISLAYKGDVEGLNKNYHVTKVDSILQGVQKTYSMIREERKSILFNYYKILYNNKPVGFMVACKGLLYSFGIAVAKRTREILLSWWDELKKITGNVFECPIYSNNVRAINFLKRRGMIVASVNEKTRLVKLLNQ